MSQKPFVHLHLHTFYSLLDGLSPPEEYIKKAVEQGSPAIAITDHGVMHGCIDFYKACKKHDIKPILGCEMYIAFNKHTDKRHQIDNKRTHVTLLAETQEGYENLLKMATIAHLEGYYYKPRIDWDLLEKYSKGIIALSGCMQGDVPQAILNADTSKAEELIERFHNVFGKKNFYLELQYHPELPQQQTINDGLIELSKKHNIPTVVAVDVHYPNSEDNVAQDIMMCIQTGRNLDDPNRLSMMNADYSMPDPDVLYKAFAHVPEALENTVKIAERCNLDFDFSVNRIPSFPVPDKKKPEEYLRELCYKGLIEKYQLDKYDCKTQEEVQKSKDENVIKLVERLEFELKIIEDMGFVGYFLIVWDFVLWAKDHNIVVGPGRGSAAGAIVAYTLDITEIDPLEYDLLFERFLNPARISMPDIDMDFADSRRDEVIEYVCDKYGRDKVAQICTFGTLAARAAIKDVGRTLGVPFSEMNDFVKLIPEKPGTKLVDAIEQSPEMKEAIENSDIFSEVYQHALKLEGAVRHVSVHACAVVIADEPLTKYTALQHPPKDDTGVITQYSAKPLESLGLLKMDFLGLKNLTILEKTLKIIDRTKKVTINLKTIPINDKKTFALLSRGETTGVFQLESPGMKRYLKELRPTEFEDIIAMVSLYRPGPMEWIPDYIAGKHGKKRTTYLHKSLEPILKNTYGIAIYQEQILQIAQVFSGFSLGGADLLRRAIGKKIIKELEAQREQFIKGAQDKGHSEELAVTIFEKVIEPFAGYGFNKSHAACYAMIAYQTAYLKAHYPTEFMTALMCADSGNTERIVVEIGECEQMGILVLPPDINESLANFTVVEDGKIRFGLSAIKGLGRGSVDMIIASKEVDDTPFVSIEDFARRAPSKILNKKTLEALAFSGAMDAIGDRRQIGINYEAISAFAKIADSSYKTGQAGLFDDMGDSAPIDQLNMEEVEPSTESERLKWEKEYLGLYVSSHPLNGLQKYFKRKTIPLDQLPSMAIKKGIKVGGLIQSFKKLTTKKGDMMAFLTIEDAFGKVDGVIFPKTYMKVADKLDMDKIIMIDGVLDKRGGEFQIIVNAIDAFSLDEIQEQAKKAKLWTEGEKISRVTRQIVQEEEVAEAESTLDVKDEDVSELSNDSLFTNPNAKQILVNKKVGKEFFEELKKLLVECPGDDVVELVIGEKVIPIPNKVNWEGCLKEKVNELLS